MRRTILLGLVLLAACNREKPFEERFSEAEADIQQRAREIEAQLAASDGDGGEAVNQTATSAADE